MTYLVLSTYQTFWRSFYHLHVHMVTSVTWLCSAFKLKCRVQVETTLIFQISSPAYVRMLWLAEPRVHHLLGMVTSDGMVPPSNFARHPDVRGMFKLDAGCEEQASRPGHAYHTFTGYSMN